MTKNNQEKNSRIEKNNSNFFRKMSRQWKRKRNERRYEKELAKEGRTSRSRQKEYGSVRETGRKLNIAIGVAVLILIIELIFVFFV